MKKKLIVLLKQKTAYQACNKILENQNGVMSHMIDLHPVITPPASPTQTDVKRSFAEQTPSEHESALDSMSRKKPKLSAEQDSLKDLLTPLKKTELS